MCDPNTKVPDVHTKEGFRLLLDCPIETLELYCDHELKEAFNHLWDALWLFRVSVIRKKCSKNNCHKIQQKQDDPVWSDCDVCSYSFTTAVVLQTFIDILIEKNVELDPPAIYPDLVGVLKEISTNLKKYGKWIESDE